MFIATSPPLKNSSLREERNVLPAGKCAKIVALLTEREPNSMTSGYKHLAPLGRNPTASTCCTSKLNSRLKNDKWKIFFAERLPEKRQRFVAG